MLPGLDLLGGPMFTRTAAGAYPAGWAVGVFWTQFGDGKKFCDAMYAAGCRIIRVQGTWDPTHKYGSDFKAKAVKAAREVDAWAKAHPLCQVFFSPFCEHNHKKDHMLPIFVELIKIANNLTYVNSIWKGQEIPGIITEVHGDAKPPKEQYLYSFDGKSCTDSDVASIKKRHAKATIFFYWESWFNGKFEAKDPALPVSQRKGWPNKKQIQSVQYLHTDKGDVSKFPARTLSKSHAERHSANDAKADKLCLILPFRASEIELRNITRQKVTTLKRFDPPRTASPWTNTVKGYRYYSTQMGFEISEIARVKTGSPIVSFDMEGKRIRFNAAFREGFY